MGAVTTAAADARSAPMATPEGRTRVWRGMRERGAVYQLPDGRWMLTSAEAVEFACRPRGV